jgi:hypothetical protein
LIIIAVSHEPAAGPRPAAASDAPIRVVARARDRRFWVSEAGLFRPLFVKGVNMGVALPGRFPTEFPEDDATYASWLEAVAGMGANCVRLYTLLPPAFYRALERHNRKEMSHRLWLVQGVWTELPEGDDYDAVPFFEGFKEEIRRVVDAVHGNLDLPARAGHASGSYRADVSSSLLALLLGREWEPYSVEDYNARRTRLGFAPFRGTYFVTDHAAPFETWIARTMDYVVAYETETYRQQRPVAFVNWPTLDPLHHATESSVQEEEAMRSGRGVRGDGSALRQHNEDSVGVDARRILPTAKALGGQFAAYHAYPYYPDFLNLDPGYLRARDSKGRSSYIGYLRDLSRHHGEQPILIAEVGVPSSRGLAHHQPQGWNHGGHDERDQGLIDARLMMDIQEAGLAGGILFALLDEWFKRNWLVARFEEPYERNPLWLNVLDPEQNFGVLAARPGKERWKVVIDGRPDDWSGVTPLLSRPKGGPMRAFGDGGDGARTLRSLAVTSDEAYLYLRLEVADLDADGDDAADWNRAMFLIGIDTYDEDRGDHRMPLKEIVPVASGLEYCLVFDGEQTGRLLIDTVYDPASNPRPYRSVGNRDGRFKEMRVETNRTRIGRDGSVYPPMSHNRSPLRHASMDRRDPDHSSLADWHASPTGNFIEARIGWGLLNVTDPSSRRVLHEDSVDLKGIGTVQTAGFRFVAASVRPAGKPGGETPLDGDLADLLPEGGDSRASVRAFYTWNEWNVPSYRIERKEAWAILKEAFERMPSGPAPQGGSPPR